MKRIASILILVFSLSMIAEGRSSLLYRVQVGAYKKEDSPKNIRQVPKLKKYVLPEGYYCFFSGGYFEYYEGASRYLAKVEELGYSDAKIRVYKDNKLLSSDAASKYIMKELANPTPIPANQKVDKQVFSIDRKRTLENRIVLYKEITQPKEENNDSLDLALNKPKINFKMKLKGLKWGGKSDKKKEKEEATKEPDEVAEDTVVVDSTLLAAVEEAFVEEKAEEIIDENDDNIMLPENFKVDDIPFFKIYLASTEKGVPTPRSVEYVPDIVYTYEKRDMTLYAVGYYKTSADAQADLARYKEKGFYNAKIIAIYKTIVVSQRMGDEILKKANN